MEPKILNGRQHKDERGLLVYYNDFHPSKLNLKRCFIIHPSKFRAWHGHKKEQNWFMPVNGDVKIMVIKPDNWENPSFELKPQEFILQAEKADILHVPGGYVTGIKHLDDNATILVFSDFTLEESLKDDYRFDKDRWYYETFM